MFGGKKVYLQPIEAVNNAIIDMMELQKGEEISNDPLYNILRYKITMYGCVSELKFTVLEIDWNRCGVTLEIRPEAARENKSDMESDRESDSRADSQYLDVIVRREFKLLDSMLPDAAPCEAAESRKYQQPKDMVLSAIHDLAALQKAKTLSSDSARGIVRLLVSMYEDMWEYRFAIEDIGRSRSCVAISIAGDAPDAKRLVENEFALLDYVLLDRARIELAGIEEWDAGMLSVSQK